MPAANTFAGATIDRAGARRSDDAWLAEQRSHPHARAVAVSADGPLVDCATDPCRPAFLPASAFGSFDEVVLLGIDAEGPLFAVDVEGRQGELPTLRDSTSLMSLRDAGSQVSHRDGALLAYATAMLNWHRGHRFCARCGHATGMAEAGHVRRCPSCGAMHYPRTDPVVIMLVHDGDRVMLGRQARWPKGRYSALAGFVEPGESLEEAVAREVSEESGVAVRDVRFSSSQPWPFPSSLMVGFHAQWAGGEPTVEDDELEDVRWFTRDELHAALRGETGINLPPPVAIARRLIDEWLEG